MDEQVGRMQGDESIDQKPAEEATTTSQSAATSADALTKAPKAPREGRPSGRAKQSVTDDKGEKGSKKVRPAKPAPAPWTFPKNPLEDTLIVARSIEEQNAGNPM